MAVLEVRNLSKIYNIEGERGGEVEALKNINLEVERGEFLSIIGPSGCGKSTLFEIIGGLRESTEGEIYIKGGRVKGSHPSIGMVFQEDSAFPWLTAVENVEFGLRMNGVKKRKRRAKAKRLIDLVGLSGFENHYPRELSGGMRQRVAIARTLVLDPEIILMDEPFGALDEQTRLLLGGELLRIWEEIGATILFVTHDIGEAVHLSDRTLVMTARPGRIKKIMENTLPRPRDPSIITTQQFNQITNEVWRELREESIKGLEVKGSDQLRE